MSQPVHCMVFFISSRWQRWIRWLLSRQWWPLTGWSSSHRSDRWWGLPSPLVWPCSQLEGPLSKVLKTRTSLRLKENWFFFFYLNLEINLRCPEPQAQFLLLFKVVLSDPFIFSLFVIYSGDQNVLCIAIPYNLQLTECVFDLICLLNFLSVFRSQHEFIPTTKPSPAKDDESTDL